MLFLKLILLFVILCDFKILVIILNGFLCFCYIFILLFIVNDLSIFGFLKNGVIIVMLFFWGIISVVKCLLCYYLIFEK